VNTLLSPIITRLYTPEDYGILTVYTAILGMVTIIGSLNYELGIPIAEDDKKAANMIALCIVVVIFVSGIIALLLFLLGNWFLKLFDGETLSRYQYLIPIGVLLTGFYAVFNQWAFRKKSFKDISKTKVSQSIAQNVTKVGLGLMGVGPIGLIFGGILGQSAGIITLAKPFLKDYSYLVKRINHREIIWSAKRYKKFPLFSAPGQLLNSAGIQLPVLFITSLYGPEVIGFYGLANGVVNLPMTLIGRSVGDVYFAEAASIGQENPLKLKALSNKLLKKLILLGLIPLFLLLFFGPTLFGLIFGGKWNEAGVYAQIIAFMVYARFVFDPIK
jgi:O-antigen/teichoic acid export membrane protein